MAFREVGVVEVREVLRGWLEGAGLRTVAGRSGVDRKTARRYVDAAVVAGLSREAGIGALSDELIAAVIAAVRPARPARPDGHGCRRPTGNENTPPRAATLTPTPTPAMLTDTSRWSHTRGNEPVPSRWQATKALCRRPSGWPARARPSGRAQRAGPARRAGE